MEYRASISTKLMVLSEPASSELVWSDESVSRSTDGGDGMLQRSGSPAGSGRIRMRSFLLPSSSFFSPDRRRFWAENNYF